MPTPAGHQAELNYIYMMVEELSRQLAENRRVTEEIVSSLHKIRLRAKNGNLSNDELLQGATGELQDQEPNFEQIISVLSEALEKTRHSRDANAQLLTSYAAAMAAMLKQFHEYKARQVADVSTWHRSYREQLAEARAENARLREQIWDVAEHASRCNTLLREYRERAWSDNDHEDEAGSNDEDRKDSSARKSKEEKLDDKPKKIAVGDAGHNPLSLSIEKAALSTTAEAGSNTNTTTMLVTRQGKKRKSGYWRRRADETARRQELRFWKRMALRGLSVDDDDPTYWSDDDDLIDIAEKHRLADLERKMAEEQVQGMLSAAAAAASADEDGSDTALGDDGEGSPQQHQQQLGTGAEIMIPEELQGGTPGKLSLMFKDFTLIGGSSSSSASERGVDNGSIVSESMIPSRPNSSGSTGSSGGR